jgi:hypothetical protein
LSANTIEPRFCFNASGYRKSGALYVKLQRPFWNNYTIQGGGPTSASTVGSIGDFRNPLEIF